MKKSSLYWFVLLVVILLPVGVQPATARFAQSPDRPPYPVPDGERDIWAGLPTPIPDVQPLGAGDGVGPSVVGDYGYIVRTQNLSESDWNTAWVPADTQGGCVHSSVLTGTGSGVEDVDLDFSFPFFEKTYTQVSLSAQGLLLFDWGADRGVPKIHNEPIAHHAIPNNFIAPFWFDLGFFPDQRPDAGVFYCSDGDQLVVLWKNGDIAKDQYQGYNGDEHYTFEAILKADGSMKMLYDMEGALNIGTIGIEDSRGWSGDQRLLNQPFYDTLAVNPGKVQIEYTHPGVSPHFSVWPGHQGQFLKAQADQYQPVDYQVQLVNYSDTAQTYALTVTKPTDGWIVELRKEPGGVVITNNEFGPVPPQQVEDLFVRLIPPPGLLVNRSTFGQNTQVNIAIKDLPAKMNTHNVHLAAAIPAPFVQGYWDNDNDSAHFSMFSGTGKRDFAQTDVTNSAVFAVAKRPLGYVYAWIQERYDSNVWLKEIKYTFLDSGGKPIWNTPEPVVRTLDYIPSDVQVAWNEQVALSSLKSGKIGVAWRNRTAPTEFAKKTFNAEFAVLDHQGNLIVGPLNLTKNILPEELTFRDIRIAALNNDSFVIAWTQKQDVIQNDEYGNPKQGWTFDVCYVIVDQNGIITKPITKLTSDTIAEKDQYYYPALLALSDGRFLMAWNKNDANGRYFVQYTVIDNKGEVKKPISNALDSGEILTAGWLDIAQFNPPDNKIVIASPYFDIHLVYIDPTSLNPTGMVIDLDNPSSLSGDQRFVSLSSTADNRMVATWGNYLFSADLDADGVTPYLYQLYYALFDSTGAIKTPPMIFVSSQDPEDPFLNLNQIGYGNANSDIVLGEVDLEVFSVPNIRTYTNAPTEVEAQYINYGNIAAAGTTLKATIGSGLTYLGASRPPNAVNPATREYTWNLQPDPVYPDTGSIKIYVSSSTVGSYSVDWQLNYGGTFEPLTAKSNNAVRATIKVELRTFYLPMLRR